MVLCLQSKMHQALVWWFAIQRVKFWQCYQKKIPQPPSVVLLKTMATRRAAYFVHKIGIPFSILKGDQEISTNAFWHGNFSSSSFSHLIKDIMFSVSSLQNYSFQHTFRQGNALAHALAKRVRFCCSFQVWMEFIPPNLYRCYIFYLQGLI